MSKVSTKRNRSLDIGRSGGGNAPRMPSSPGAAASPPATLAAADDDDDDDDMSSDNTGLSCEDYCLASPPTAPPELFFRHSPTLFFENGQKN